MTSRQAAVHRPGPSGRSPASSWRPGRRTVAAACVALVGIAACGKKEDASKGGPQGPQGPMPVTVVDAQVKRFPITVESVGQSEGSKEVQVRARVSGILEKQRYSEGDRVKAGSILFEIDPVPYQIAQAQARAALDQQRATLEQSKREETRLQPLVAEQAISGKDYDASVTTRKTSEALIAARQADLRNADLNLGYTKVVAPISGVSGRAQNSVGTLVTAGADSSLLTTISQPDPIWVRFSISETEYAALRGQSEQNDAKVELVLPDGKTYASPGKLNFAASTVDRNLGTVQLRAEVPNPTLRILPGQFVRARLYVGEVEGVLVPQAAVMTSDKGKAVMVVGPENKVTPRPVEAGSWQGNQVIITKGLATGDKVIVDNLAKLRPGAPVSPHPPQAAGAPPAGQPPAAGDAPKSDAAAPKADSKQ